MLTLFALANSLVTIATSHASGYRGALLTALISDLLALGCFAFVFIRGRLGWRIVAVIFASPSIFVLWDFAQRAPAVFGG